MGQPVETYLVDNAVYTRADRLSRNPSEVVSFGVGDADGDGDIDVAVGLSDRRIDVFRNDGGLFGTRVNVQTNVDPDVLRVGRVTGAPALAFADLTSNALQVSFASSNGASYPPGPVLPTLATEPTGLALGGVCPTGQEGVVSTIDEVNGVGVYCGAAQTFARRNIYVLAPSPSGVRVQDVDGDGRADVVVLGSDGRIAYAKNVGNGFRAAQVVTIPEANGIFVMDELTRPDGLDIAAGLTQTGTAAARLAVITSTTSTSETRIIDLPSDIGPAIALASGPLANNDRVDVVVASKSGGAVLFNEGNATFRAESLGLPTTVDVAVGDIDLDAVNEVVFALENGVYTQQFNPLDTAFQPVIGDRTVAVAVDPTATAVGFVLADPARRSIFVFEWNGQRWGQPRRLDVGLAVDDVAVSVRSGGDLDLVGLGEGQVFVLRREAGTFRQPETYATSPDHDQLVIVDVNRDGIDDVVTFGDRVRNSSLAFSLLSSPAGRLSSPVPVVLSGVPQSAQTVDLDGDGAPDLVLGHQGHLMLLSIDP